MSRRRSTIHDAAALRLHPSGVRVTLPSGEVKQPTSSVVTAKNKRPLLDARGNWIASDAGGDGRVVKRRKVNNALETDKMVDEGLEENVQEGQSEVPVKIYKDARANRRVAFENDWTFLAEPSPPLGGGTFLPRPSSDFLKCIHYCASQHYASTGQLFDSAAQYRKEKKEKLRLRMLQAQQAQTPDAKDTAEESEEQDEDLEEEPKATPKAKGKARARAAKQTSTQRDMYKAFNGTALLCIGMLLQSHISSQLQDPASCKPDGWDDDLVEIEEDGKSTTESDGGGNYEVSNFSSSPR